MAIEAMRLATDQKRGLPRKLSFTVAALAAAKCPPGKGRTWLYDSRAPGLMVMVTESGSKQFYTYKKFNGVPERYRLGGVDEISIEQARDLTANVMADYANGISPQQAKQRARGEGTFGSLFKLFMDQHAKIDNRSWQTDQARYKKHLERWENRKASSITREDVQALHAQIGKESPGAANRVLSLISQIFGHSGVVNPGKGVKRFKETERERFLSATELPVFLKALAKEKNKAWRDFFGLCLWTGQRSGNVKTMEWAELDLANKTWRIPSSKFKNGKEQTAHLTEDAIEILKRRQKTKCKEDAYVFPSRSKEGYLRWPRKAWEALLKRAKIRDLWIHDLRRTHASWMVAAGTPMPVIQKAMGHRSPQTTSKYARLDLSQVRSAVDLAAKAMRAAKGGAK